MAFPQKPLLTAAFKTLTPARLRILRLLSEGGYLIRYSRSLVEQREFKACRVYFMDPKSNDICSLPLSIWCWLKDMSLIKLYSTDYKRSVWTISEKGLKLLRIYNDNSIINETIL